MKHYILDALKNHNLKEPCSYHMPGHKSGSFLPQALKDAWGEDFASYDITEINGTDNLHNPQECILKSQQQAAQIYNAKNCYYLINGTSGGLIGAILANCYRKKVFVPRHCHISILHGLILAQAEPVYLPITMDEATQLPLGVSLETLKEALKSHPDCSLLLMVNPTYQGITWQNGECLSYALECGLTVLVDEAHGGHFHFHPALPASLLDCGAHLVVQSWHKMLPSLTQTSALLTNMDYNGGDMQVFLGMVETSSPSYPLLCSLEACAIEMHQRGYEKIDASLLQIQVLSRHIDGLETLRLLKGEDWKQDPFKLNLASDCLSGNDLARLLEEEFALFCEMSDVNSCLLLLPLDFTSDACKDLCDVLSEIDAKSLLYPLRKVTGAFYTEVLPKVAIPLKDAFYMPKDALPLEDCVNCIAGDFVKLYPPGIPLLMPGEIITEEIVALWLKNGARPEDKIAIIPER